MLRELHLFVLGHHVTLSTHALMIALAFGVGTLVMVCRASDRGVALLLSAALATGALLGSRALYRALHGAGTGLSSMGGIAAAVAVAMIGARVAGRRLAEILDWTAPAGLLALAVGRIGCFLAGCCFGRPTTVPWAMVFPDLGSLPRHPLQLYSALGDLALVALLLRTRGPTGTVARRAFVGFGCLRAVLELFRDPAATDRLPGGWLTLAQAGALGLAAVGAASAAACTARLVPLCVGDPRAARAERSEESRAWPTRNR